MIYDLRHEDWELAGYEIAEHTNNGPVDWGRVENVTIHYPGAGTWPYTGNVDWFQGYMRNMQNYYVNQRGYSIGYNEVVTQNGLVAEARGANHTCGANGNWDVNVNSYAIQVVVNGNDAASTAAVDTIRERIDWVQQQAGRKLKVVGHRDHKPTPCPGTGLYTQILNGVFDVPFEEGIMRTYKPINKRLWDTRKADPLEAGDVLTLAAFADAVEINVTVFAVSPGDPAGHISATAGVAAPGQKIGTSILTMQPGLVLANTTTVQCDSQGRFSLVPVVPMHVVVDLIGVYSTS